MRIDSYMTNAADCQSRSSAIRSERDSKPLADAEDTVVLRSLESQSGDTRAEKVERLRLAVQAGTYKPAAEAVANAVLNELVTFEN